MVLVAYRHGLRVSELVLRWEQVDLRTATLHVRRVKKGPPFAIAPDNEARYRELEEAITGQLEEAYPLGLGRLAELSGM
jgi:hypothetical protein